MWRITWGDRSLTADQATGLHLLAVTALLRRDDWSARDPSSSPQVLLAWLSVISGLPVATIAASPLAAITDAVEFVTPEGE